MSAVAWKERGKGDALVFLHGVGGGAESWDAQLSAFGTTHRAMAWDMPGYGGSDDPAAPGFDGWVAALAGWLDATGVAGCTLVGHSIGGMIAQLFAARHPQRVTRLVLSATSAAFGNPDGAFQRAFLESRLAPLDAGRSMAELAAEFVPGLVGLAAPEAARRAAVATMSRVRPETYRAAMTALVGFDARAELPGVTAPAVLIAGEDDPAAPVKAMERLAERLPDARLIRMPGMGHLGNIEQPDAYNSVLRAVLSGRPVNSIPEGID
jgi:3-oxoadipate enol-lactonase